MQIIDHLSVGVPSIANGCAFYDGLLATLGCSRLATTDGFAAYGKETVDFLIMLPFNKQPYSAGNGTHICFKAAGREEVDAFHTFAIANGGVCEGEPGPRDGYPNPDVHTAYVRDPFGNKLEVIFGGFAA
ncbi:VOC family protein [Pyruvatibacter sp.]|uniref:VOC family protein n=1 Tax=Pyruvatibacter sp. TaxID=1981328 RepID=UPI00326763B6